MWHSYPQVWWWSTGWQWPLFTVQLWICTLSSCKITTPSSSVNPPTPLPKTITEHSPRDVNSRDSGWIMQYVALHFRGTAQKNRDISHINELQRHCILTRPQTFTHLFLRPVCNGQNWYAFRSDRIFDKPFSKSSLACAISNQSLQYLYGLNEAGN